MPSVVGKSDIESDSEIHEINAAQSRSNITEEPCPDEEKVSHKYKSLTRYYRIFY